MDRSDSGTVQCRSLSRLSLGADPWRPKSGWAGFG